MILFLRAVFIEPSNAVILYFELYPLLYHHRHRFRRADLHHRKGNLREGAAERPSPMPPKNPASTDLPSRAPILVTTFPARPILPSESTINPLIEASITDSPFLLRQLKLTSLA